MKTKRNIIALFTLCTALSITGCAGQETSKTENTQNTAAVSASEISIRAKILTGMIACVLIVTNLIGWFFIVQAKDTLLEQCKKNARNSAKIAAERIDGDILG